MGQSLFHIVQSLTPLNAEQLKIEIENSILHLRRSSFNRLQKIAKQRQSKSRIWRGLSCYLKNWVKFRQDSFMSPFQFLFCSVGHILLQTSTLICHVPYRFQKKTQIQLVLKAQWSLENSVGCSKDLVNTKFTTFVIFLGIVILDRESICWVLGEFARLCTLLKSMVPF